MHLLKLTFYSLYQMSFIALTTLIISTGLIIVGVLAWIADKFNWLD